MISLFFVSFRSPDLPTPLPVPSSWLFLLLPPCWRLPLKGDKSSCCQKTTLGVREQPTRQPSMAREAKASRRTATALVADGSGPGGASSPAGPRGPQRGRERGSD